MTDFFDDIVFNKKREKTTADILYEVPQKRPDKLKPKIQKIKGVVQADLLELPDDKGYKYALVCVDNATRLCDAEALKNKSSNTVLGGFLDIFTREIIKEPKRLEIDSGAEFKGEVKEYFDNLNVDMKIGKVGRHKHQAIVENRNKMIGDLLNKKMVHEEVASGKKNTEWKKNLPKVIEVINKRTATRLKKEAKKEGKFSVVPKHLGAEVEILPIGTRVRVALDYPINTITGERVYGGFRKSDIRFNPIIRTVKRVIMEPMQPVFYILSDEKDPTKTEPVRYDIYDLQVVSNDEKAPKTTKKITKETTYIIERLVRKFKEGNKVMFEVKWQGYKDTTNEPRSQLIKDVPDLVKEFEKKK
jgi:hypothetical protein